ncbi:hypothetical protein [Anaerotignum sp.]|uniref:hypothetical protein n=1 Tax=Anaerotignum sp. TaxID=2039241 RepID=UPI0028970DB8|nr:hypothetical protein [Anaerotignum sp.]
MGRKSKTPFNPWETAKENGIEERYIRSGNSQLLHPVFIRLSNSAKVTYMYMRLESGGKIEFEFPASKYIILMSKHTFLNAKEELIKNGFIEERQNNKNIRKPNIYRFSANWRNLK